MKNRIKKVFLSFLNKRESELSNQIDFARSVIASDYYPEDVKIAVADILRNKQNRLAKNYQLKTFFS